VAHSEGQLQLEGGNSQLDPLHDHGVDDVVQPAAVQLGINVVPEFHAVFLGAVVRTEADFGELHEGRVEVLG